MQNKLLPKVDVIRVSAANATLQGHELYAYIKWLKLLGHQMAATVPQAQPSLGAYYVGEVGQGFAFGGQLNEVACGCEPTNWLTWPHFCQNPHKSLVLGGFGSHFALFAPSAT